VQEPQDGTLRFAPTRSWMLGAHRCRDNSNVCVSLHLFLCTGACHPAWMPFFQPGWPGLCDPITRSYRTTDALCSKQTRTVSQRPTDECVCNALMGMPGMQEQPRMHAGPFLHDSLLAIPLIGPSQGDVTSGPALFCIWRLTSMPPFLFPIQESAQLVLKSLENTSQM
jgi:hypothetical protein